MGNYISYCTFVTAPRMKNSKAARVIFPSGEARQFREPVKAAELMLECPNFFLVNSQSLHIGRRFAALSADEDVEFGNVYIMFPMKRVNSVITAGDVAVLFMAANTAAKRISGGNVRISPDSSADGNAPEVAATATAMVENSLESEVEGFPFPAPEFRYRLAVCRSRKPLLATIKEESVCSR